MITLETATLDQLLLELGKRMSSLAFVGLHVDEDVLTNGGLYSMKFSIKGDMIHVLGLLEGLKIRMIESGLPDMIREINSSGSE